MRPSMIAYVEVIAWNFGGFLKVVDQNMKVYCCMAVTVAWLPSTKRSMSEIGGHG